MREIEPQHKEFWFRIYGSIAKTGEPHRFQHEAKALGRFYDVYAFRIGQPGQNKVAIIFNDILVRVQAETAPNRSEQKYRTILNAVDVGFVFGSNYE